MRELLGLMGLAVTPQMPVALAALMAFAITFVVLIARMRTDG